MRINREKIWKFILYLFAGLGLISAIYLMVGFLLIPLTRTTKIVEQKPVERILPTPTSYTLRPTPTLCPKIPIPKDWQWIEYPAKCPGLSGVKIYYPSNWETASFGETHRPLGGDQCEISFGYPIAPESPHELGHNEYGRVSVDSWQLEKEEENTLEWWKKYYANNQINSWVSSVSEKSINGKRFLLLTQGDYDNEAWMTIHKARAYFIDTFTTNPDAEFKGYTKEIGEGFAQRLVFR